MQQLYLITRSNTKRRRREDDSPEQKALMRTDRSGAERSRAERREVERRGEKWAATNDEYERENDVKNMRR